VQTTGLFGCLGARIPTHVRRDRGALVVDLGKIIAPPNPCLDAEGPAEGGIALPAQANGATTVRLRYRGKEDRYRLVVAADSLQFSPLHTTFSQLASPQVHVRVPAGALHLQCAWYADLPSCREKAAGGAPTCETLFADPVIAGLEPLHLPPANYSPAVFHTPGGCNVRAPGDVEALKRHILERYAYDPCLSIRLYTSRGDGTSNLRPPAG
jgi:hypothetical protein